MASTSDVTVAEGEGQGNVKTHPYLITMMRWCVSCIWSTATVLLHRLMRAQVPQIAAPKPVRSTGTDHLHPEPKVECVILHEPPSPNLDVIFVHGLYGSLGNTWRQGDWRTKYKIDPNVVQLRNHSSKRTCNCHKLEPKSVMKEADPDNESKCKVIYDTVNFNESTHDDINERIKLILPNENSIITENFYNNLPINDEYVSENYKTQAKFVQDLFDKSKMYDSNDKCNNENKCKSHNECKCRMNKSGRCEVGCGCVCDDCYSNCWPKDWIKMDFPGARVISINYTTDPYLWRPLWVKGNVRLRLHERAEQMMAQLLGLGVGRRPIVWVGHSKGGLFIKQIYCEAFETHLKLSKINDKNTMNCNNNKSSIIDSNKHTDNHENIDDYNNEMLKNRHMNVTKHSQDDILLNISNKDESDYRISIFNNNDMKQNTYLSKSNGGLSKYDFTINKEHTFNETLDIIEIDVNSEGESEVQDENKIVDRNLFVHENILGEDTIVSIEELEFLKNKANLWRYSAGFMFYSVPHRGSPLADIKTPITSRSIELLEISKDCSLVLSLQDRWLMASSPSKPVVRSLVETCRTLMSVLWLRIVSVDSADAGIGDLRGVSLDHREICKPSSRSCLLYTQLTDLIHTALNKCQCH